MPDWKHRRLLEVCDFSIGGTPSRSNLSLWAEKPDGWPWLSIADLKNKYVEDSEEHISNAGVSSSNAKLIPAETTVMSFKLTVGRTAILTRPMFCNEAIAYFKPKEAHVDSRWLYHELPRASKRVVTDTAVKGSTLNKQKIAQIPLHLPPIEEQRQIARILDVLDTQIQRTEALIGKLEQKKQGLLSDLLTRGIDENGQLRPSPDRAPNLYNNSTLGAIPKDWKVDTVGALLASIDAGWSPSCPADPPQEGEWGVLKVSAVSSGYFNPAKSKRLPEKLAPIEELQVYPNDILMIRANGAENLVGRCVLVESTPPRLMLSDKTLRLRPLLREVEPFFLTALMSSTRVRRKIAGLMSGSSGQKNISQSQVRSITVAVAPIAEQTRIRARVVALERRIRTERCELEKLRKGKFALMDDLLTGRVRVTPLLNQTERATG